MKFFLPSLVLVLLWPVCTRAQVNIPVYLNAQSGDSVDKVYQAFRTELSRSGRFQFQSQPASAFRNKGVLFILSKEAGAAGISLPPALNQLGPEGIWINATNKSVILCSNSAFGLQEAMYFYLEQLGFHYFMPGDVWTVIPDLSSPYRKFCLLTKPDFDCRDIVAGHAFGNNEKLTAEYNHFNSANGLGGAFRVATGHSYEAIVQENEALFKAHPEYFARPVNAGTIPQEFKFNVANPDLVNFLISNAIKRYEINLRFGYSNCMVSMEPSDGGGFGDKKELKAIGSPSNQVYSLNNKVARALRQKYPEAWVGGYAYNEHILPPDFKLEPNIYVEITNGFNRTQYSTLDLLKLWKQKASKVGIYDYLGVFEWSFDMPGQVPAARTAEIKKAVLDYYKAGVRVFQGETTMGWVNRGPGQFMLSKLFWNTRINTDSLLNVFYTSAFQGAAPYIKQLYSAWENYKLKIPAEDDLADWCSLINQAAAAAKTQAVQNRIDAIKKYMVYIGLYRDLKANTSKDNLFRLMRFAFRNFEDPQFPALPVLVSMPNYAGQQGQGLGWNDNPQQPWKDDKRPYTAAELQQDFAALTGRMRKTEGLQRFSSAESFVRLQDVLNIPAKNYGSPPHSFWYNVEYVVQIAKKDPSNYIEIRSDFIDPSPNQRPVLISFYPVKNTAGAGQQPLLQFSQTAHNKVEKFSLDALPAGSYRMVVEDQGKMFSLNFGAGLNHSILAGFENGITTTSVLGLNWFYFYVPPGVTKFQISKSNGFMLETSSGRKIDKSAIKEETFDVLVQPGESGIWTIGWQGGYLALKGVPPYLGDSPASMLVPASLRK